MAVSLSLSIAGISHRKHAANRFIAAIERKLIVEREPTNPVDPKAILVRGEWLEGGRTETAILGYVPREHAAKVADQWPNAQLVGVLRAVCPLNPRIKNPGITFALFREKQQKRSKQVTD